MIAVTETPTGTTNYLDNGLIIEGGMTQPSKPGKQPRPVWNVSGSTLAFEPTLYDLGGRKWKGKFSFWEDPTKQLALLDNEEKMSFAEQQEYLQEKAERRADRLEARAEKHSEVAEQASNFVWSTVKGLNGQPILVGHHSERRHRNLLDKIDRSLGKAVQEREYAGELSRRAKGNRQKASGEVSPIYVGNRIVEVKAAIASLNRSLEQLNKRKDKGDDVEQYIKRTQLELSEKTKQLEYWTAKYTELTNDAYNSTTIAKGDYIKYRNSRWLLVERVNAKSVTCRPYNETWTNTIPYHEITGHMAGYTFQKYIDQGKVTKQAIPGYIITGKLDEETDSTVESEAS